MVRRLLLCAALVFATIVSVDAAFRFRVPKAPQDPALAKYVDDMNARQPVKAEAVHIRTHALLKSLRKASPDHADSMLADLRERSRVRLPASAWAVPPTTDPYTYSGYITVNQTYDSNMFYWFFEAQNGDVNAPILLWLQGGPGGSSLFGLFGENGPFSVDDNLNLVPRNITWNSKYALLYIDNPVGVGFSYTNNQNGFSTTEPEVAQNLYTALAGFFTVYPMFAKNDFYITGESYAGKYLPALGYKILTENANPNRAVTINLKGLAIGDGLTDPITQVTAYADILFNVGMADESQRAYMYSCQNNIVSLIKQQKWAAASQAFSDLVNGPPDYYSNITGSSDYYELRRSVGKAYGGPYDLFVNQSSIRAALHVGNNYYYEDGSTAGDVLNDDICKSVVDVVPDLLANYKVLFYNGQWDFIVAPATTEAMLYNLQWPGLPVYKSANRTIWRINPNDDQVAGWVRSALNLTQLVLRGAGHIVPGDQPARAFDMIDRFVSNRPWTQ